MSTDTKTVRVGLDAGSLNTLPGNSAEISVESSDNTNTIYGSRFDSTLPGVKSYTISANAWLRQTPGFRATVKRAGESTPLTDEATTQVDTTQTYRITEPSRRLLDYKVEVVVEDDGGEVADADIESIDHMFGAVTFASDYSVTGDVTISGAYLPTAEFGCANNISITQSAESVDNSCFDNVQAENGFMAYSSGLQTVSAELSGFYRTTSDFFDLVKNNTEVILEVDWEGSGETMSRGIFTVSSTSQSGDVGSNEEFSATFSLFVPEEITPYSFYFGSGSEAGAGFQDIITAWETGSDLFFDYYPEGTGSKGYDGKVVVTDASISTSVDGLGELSLSGQGNGELGVVNAP